MSSGGMADDAFLILSSPVATEMTVAFFGFDPGNTVNTDWSAVGASDYGCECYDLTWTAGV